MYVKFNTVVGTKGRIILDRNIRQLCITIVLAEHMHYN